MKLFSLYLAAAAAVIAAGNQALAADKDQKPGFFQTYRLPKDATLAATPTQIMQAAGQLGHDAWKPRVNDEKSRGVGAKIYASAAPCVAVVRHSNGHGTGAVIDPQGWIVTNHHVIEGAPLDSATGARAVTIFFGKLNNGLMEVSGNGVPALVWKSDEAKDLALVKLKSLPPGMKAVPAVSLATTAIKPGSDCVSIGHPTSGLLWTVRSGEVSGIGKYPKDLSGVIATTLVESATTRKALAEILGAGPQKKAIVSTCGVTYGDSGGPLLDPEGKLIGVTFAMPSMAKAGTAKFGYHVHLDDVKAFLANRPASPETLAVDPWPPGLFASIRDEDGDGIPDTVAFGRKPGGPLTGILMDLKQETGKNIKVADLLDPKRRAAWKFQFALQGEPVMRAFYATGTDGKIDLVLTASGNDAKVDSVLRLDKGVWKPEAARGRLIDPSLFADKAMRERFIKIMSKLAKK